MTHKSNAQLSAARLRTTHLTALAAAIARQRWQVATTMPQHPHEYTLRRAWYTCHDISFDKAVSVLRTYGTDERFFRQTYRYLYLNGWQYWTMGAPLPETILINRARPTMTVPLYEHLGAEYNALFDDPASRQENAEVFRRLDVIGRVLDIGCGTGLLLQGPLEAMRSYTGIDPSSTMIATARAQYPHYAKRFVQCPFEQWYGTGYNRIYALFGTASYLHPHDVARIPDMLAPGGFAFLMYYDEEYLPKTHQAFPYAAPAVHRTSEGELLFGKYRVITLRHNIV